MPIAVLTGSAGSIGRVLKRALLADGWEVRGLDLHPDAGDTVADITAPGPWVQTLDGADLVIHTAAIVGRVTDTATWWRVNVEGTRVVLEAAADAGVGRAVHLSSFVVQGPAPGPRVDETAPIHPTGAPYTDTKAAAEHQALRIALETGLPLTIVRPGDVYGPGVRAWVDLPIEAMRTGLFAVPAGGAVMHPVYIDDLVAGVLAAATTPGAVGRIINLVGPAVPTTAFFRPYARALGRPLVTAPAPAIATFAAVVTRAARLVGRDLPVSADQVEYIDHPADYSIARAEQLLGWRPQVPFEEGMARTLEWARTEGLLP